MSKIFDWNKIYRSQEENGWCGPAVIQMIFLAVGIDKSQKDIAGEVFFPWWGTHRQVLVAYLSRFFTNMGFLDNADLLDVSKLILSGKIVLVNWWDDLDGKDDEEGHYCLAVAMDDKEGTLTLVDPSEGRGVWKIKQDEFEKRWYDFYDVRNIMKAPKWLMWVDPSSLVQ